MSRLIRNPICSERCITKCGAVLDVSGNIEGLLSDNTKTVVGPCVHDPDCIDPGGQYIGVNEIQLLWRVKGKPGPVEEVFF